MDLRTQLQNARKANDRQTAQILAADMDSKEVFPVLIYAVTEKQSDFTADLYTYLSETHRGELFVLAVETRNITMVRALLPNANPHFANSSALQMASATRNQEIFDLLYPLSQPQKALKDMKKYSRSFEYKMLEEAMEQAHIQRALQGAIKSSKAQPNTKKKM